ncbi:hypothetical protein TYRP_021274 [Tyrophagus putrescentiae]|nr:hypothetical protein TYRP_021274 [Tyrophagus putrescentiae]
MSYAYQETELLVMESVVTAKSRSPLQPPSSSPFPFGPSPSPIPFGSHHHLLSPPTSISPSIVVSGSEANASANVPSTFPLFRPELSPTFSAISTATTAATAKTPVTKNKYCQTDIVAKNSYFMAAIVSILSNPMYLILLITHVSFQWAWMTYQMIIFDFAIDLKLSRGQSVSILVGFAVADLIGRVISGWVADRGMIQKNHIVSICILCIGFFIQLTSMISSYRMHLTLSLFLGFTCGTIIVLFNLLTMEYVGLDHLPVALGLSAFFVGVTSLIRPYFIGLFRDVIGSYLGLFRFVGTLAFIAAFLWLMEPFAILHYKRRAKVKVQGTTTNQLKCDEEELRIIGNQLVPVFPVVNRLGVVHLLLNIFVITLALHYLIVVDVLFFRQMVKTIDLSKPLFAVLVRFFMQYGMLSMVVSTQLHTLLFGSTIIEVLGSPLFTSVDLYHQKVSVVLIAAAFAVANTLTVATIFRYQFSVWWAWPPTLTSLTACLVIYVIASNTYFYLHLLLYAQYGIRVLLRGLELALLHDRLLHLTSFPLAYKLFFCFIQFVVVWGLLGLFYQSLWDLLMLFYPGATWGYIAVLIILNENNLKSFDRLTGQLAGCQKRNRGSKRRKLIWNNIFQEKLDAEADVLQFRQLVANLLPVKPLFSLLVKAFLQFGELSMIITSQVYSLIYGPEVIRLCTKTGVHQALVLLNFLHSLCRGPEVVATLNCSLFSSIPLYNDWKRLRIVLSLYLLYNLSLYVSAFHSILLRYLNSSLNNGLYLAGTFLALFIINANAHFYLHLLLFMQYGTLAVLRQQLPLQSSVQNVRTLALANDRLSSLVSLPLTTYLVLFLAESISTFTTFGYFQKRRWDKKLYAVYPTVTWLYIAALVYFNRKVLQEFDRFNTNLRGKVEGWTRLKVFELTKQYRARLQLRLFRLITIDASFVLACLLFTLNFVVFLVQTN